MKVIILNGSPKAHGNTATALQCACGEGTLDINLYAQLATAESPRMPMIIEHLTTDEEYVASVQYVRDRLS